MLRQVRWQEIICAHVNHYREWQNKEIFTELNHDSLVNSDTYIQLHKIIHDLSLNLAISCSLSIKIFLSANNLTVTHAMSCLTQLNIFKSNMQKWCAIRFSY